MSWTPIGFKKPAHETATLKNFLSLIETRCAELQHIVDNPHDFNLFENDLKWIRYEIEVLEKSICMGYDMAHRGYDIVIQTNYAKAIGVI